MLRKSNLVYASDLYKFNDESHSPKIYLNKNQLLNYRQKRQSNL